MKTIKILLCATLLFSSCLSVNHKTRRYDAEGLTYRYGFYYVDNMICKFYNFYENGNLDESYKFKQQSDSTWKCSYNDETCSLTGQIVKYKDNHAISFSFEGYDISDDYSIQVYTTEDIKYDYDYLAGTVRLEISQNNQSIGWGQFDYKDETFVITTGTE